MYPAIRSLAAVVLTAVIVTPSLAAPRPGGTASPLETGASDRNSVLARETASIERQQKVWSRLSASICAGCITAANRVAPSNYERTMADPITETKLARGELAPRLGTAPRSFANFTKHFTKHLAKLHRHDRRRLASRARRLRLAALRARRHRLAMRVRHHAVHVAAFRPRHPAMVPVMILPISFGGFGNRVYTIPAEYPMPVRDGGR